MNKEELLRVFGYLEVLNNRLERDLEALEADISKEQERKQSIEKDYKKWIADIKDLQVKIQKEADMRE